MGKIEAGRRFFELSEGERWPAGTDNKTNASRADLTPLSALGPRSDPDPSKF